MPDASKAELLRSLGRLVRGLSSLFWGLPLALIVYVQTARGTDWLDFFGAFAIVPAIAITGLLLYGLWQMSYFQKQERIWHQAIQRAEVLCVINLGLAPFLFWWHKLPFVPFYAQSVGLLALSSLLFLFNLNYVLRRLTAMLPDETLRSETKLFTTFNCALLLSVFLLLAIFFGLQEFGPLPEFLDRAVKFMMTQGLWLILFFILMPLAMTMALIWKIKEVIFASVLEVQP